MILSVANRDEVFGTHTLLVVKIQGRLRKPRAYCLIWSIVVLGGNSSAITRTPPLLLTRQGIAHAVADASNLSGELMTAWNQIPPSVFSAMWADTGDHGYIAVTGRTRRLGLKASEEIGGLFASFVGRLQ
jgi:hypothetical protein